MKRWVLSLLVFATTAVQAIGVNQVGRPPASGRQPPGQPIRPYPAPPGMQPLTPAPGLQHYRDPTLAPDPMAAQPGESAAVAAGSPDVAYTYDAVGNRESATYKNGVVVLYAHDRRNRLTDLHASKGGTLLHHYHYTLDPSGLRTKVEATDADGATTVVNYTYDFVKRLTNETQTRNGVLDFSGHYEYDRAGNRVLATVNGITTTYVYDANDRLTSETTASGPLAGTTTYTHDLAGNVLTKSGPSGLVEYEPPRLSRRLHLLRGWSNEQVSKFSERSTGACGSAGAGTAGQPRIAMVGDRFGRGKDRLYARDVAALGASG